MRPREHATKQRDQAKDGEDQRGTGSKQRRHCGGSRGGGHGEDEDDNSTHVKGGPTLFKRRTSRISIPTQKASRYRLITTCATQPRTQVEESARED
eukprot:2593673-Pleurochrysis_carterae.AAC.1